MDDIIATRARRIVCTVHDRRRIRLRIWPLPDVRERDFILIFFFLFKAWFRHGHIDLRMRHILSLPLEHVIGLSFVRTWFSSLTVQERKKGKKWVLESWVDVRFPLMIILVASEYPIATIITRPR